MGLLIAVKNLIDARLQARPVRAAVPEPKAVPSES
jgi:hypothetical protein